MTTDAPPTSESEPSTANGWRRRLKEERCQRSSSWQIIHWLGSMQLALFLLATISVALAAATITEARISSKIAHAYIYKAPWFQVWLVVLCVNLLAATITRWPWERRHIGFIVTHYGIIVLLVGAVIGSNTGFEGNVTLRRDAPPVTRVITSRSVIQIESPADGYQYLAPFDAETAQPTPARPRVFPIPGTKLKIVALDHSSDLIHEPILTASTAPGAAPGVLLRIRSALMGQEHAIALHAGARPEDDFFGMARIRLGSALPDVAPPGPVETRMVFAKYDSVSDNKTPGVVVRLSEDGKRIAIFDAEGHGAAYAREDIMGKPVTEAGATVVVEKFWPDFAMKDGRPISQSDNPNNPAILVRISPAAEGGHQTPTLDLAIENGGLAYRLSRNDHPYASGRVAPGESFPLGWADWEAEATTVLPASELTSQVRPGTGGIPGFLARLEGPEGARGPERWVESGEVTALTEGNHVVRVGYGLEARPLPFSMRLLNFEIPRDEGTDAPSNFLATVEFRDSKTGAIRTGVAQMNHPASYPGTFFANMTGINYKFSQAEWNPRNLQETTLQVLYDPGWLLKWIGSLAVCVGIALEFYWKPKSASSRRPH